MIKNIKRASSAWVFVLSFTTLFVIAVYTKIGYWREVPSYQRHQQVQETLQRLGGLSGLIVRLKTRLKKHPDPKGYFLLGRLYASKGMWKQATAVLQKSVALAPQNTTYREAYKQAKSHKNLSK